MPDESRMDGRPPFWVVINLPEDFQRLLIWHTDFLTVNQQATGNIPTIYQLFQQGLCQFSLRPSIVEIATDPATFQLQVHTRYFPGSGCTRRRSLADSTLMYRRRAYLTHSISVGVIPLFVDALNYKTLDSLQFDSTR
jgi:hypothetical protein